MPQKRHVKRRRDQKKKCAIRGAIPRCKYGSSLTSGAAASLVKRLSVCVMRSKTKKKRLKTQRVRVHERDQSLLALRRDQHKLRVAAAADAAELNHSSHMVHSKQEGIFSFFFISCCCCQIGLPSGLSRLHPHPLVFSVPPCGDLHGRGLLGCVRKKLEPISCEGFAQPRGYLQPRRLLKNKKNKNTNQPESELSPV